MARSGLVDQPVHPLPVHEPVLDALEAQTLFGLPGVDELESLFPSDAGWIVVEQFEVIDL